MIRSKQKPANQGFALIATLLMMVLLAIVSVGLLSLSTISLRSTSNGQAQRVAEGNARLAMMLALGDLQKTLGDDRRITANASILGTANQTVSRPQMVGVWDSATSDIRQNPTSSSNSIPYAKWKTDLFKKWLVSSKDEQQSATLDFGKSAVADDDSVPLFETEKDGFDLGADRITIPRSGKNGESSMAWAVVQEGDKAHISQPGEVYQEKNDVIQAPMQPNLALSGVATQPTAGWNARATKLISLNQAALDPDYQIDRKAVPQLSTDYTVWSKGVLADVTKGGLKTDLNLAFELPDSSFAKTTWDGLPNPFRNGSAEVFLHGQVNSGRTVNTTVSYGGIKNQQDYPVGSATTFDMLRSGYGMYRHLYLSGGSVTAFERPQVNKAWSAKMGAVYQARRGSETSLSPVLDRMVYVLSLMADDSGIPCLVISPVITLWNPYNVAIESEGYVAYPWMDIPMYLNFQMIGAGGAVKESKGTYLSHLIGAEKTSAGEGRQVEAYFHCNITGSGTSPSTTPVRLEPGEIRVFVPSDKTTKLYERKAAVTSRIWNMKPSSGPEDLNLTGGVRIDTSKGISGAFTNKMAAGDKLKCDFTFQPDIYHYFTTLEDSTKIKNPNAKGTIINEVQLYKGSTGSSFSSAEYVHAAGAKPKMVGVLETYHRTALQTGQQADIVQTVNARQRYINAAVSGAKFLAGPHYHSSLRQGTALAGVGMQTTPDGKRAYYGGSNSPGGGVASGREKVVLFDVPRQAPISLASFQNSDLADTAFSPSNQFANSWASPYLNRNTIGRVAQNTTTGEKISPSGLGIYDHSWLLNDALWDGYFMSSITPQVEQTSGSASPGNYDKEMVKESQKVDEMIDAWVENPMASPLRNSHMTLHDGGVEKEEIKSLLKADSGSLRVAEHMMVQGAFNVNSTNEAAWRAMLSSLRGQEFDILTATGGIKSYQTAKTTPAPRFSTPSGTAEDAWNGFRELSDKQIESLAKEIVVEVKSRGPFQSLSEFVNRRVENGELGLKGALQAAIDRSKINDSAKITTFDKSSYFAPTNLPEPYTTTGLTNWLTQADVLGPIASVITVRSDTFRIRGYGEVKNSSGAVIARATCEAVVQRLPEWIDPADKPGVKPANLTSPANQAFGRRFEVVSFRMLSTNELSHS
ncbi:MAG: hypothetical protein V4584_08330 [Verrucomicrobiota bacterium]